MLTEEYQLIKWSKDKKDKEIRRRNMGVMLELMDGMEIRTHHGSFLVVGPNVYQEADVKGQRIYRVVFMRRPTPTAHEVNEPAPRPQNQPDVLLNGNLNPAEGDDVPLLNRLDLNDADGVPVVEENVVPYRVEENGFANGNPNGNEPEDLDDQYQPDH